jgi:hypothetical protein
MVKTKVTVAILVLALALFCPFAIQAKPTPTPPGGHLNITQVFVDVPPGLITINGTDLDFGPGPLVVTLGNFGPLDNCSGDDMTIVCDLPEGILKGDYLLTVSNGNGQSQGDEYDLTVCSDLAPACFDANNWSDTDDGDGFIADCISSAGCSDAQDVCENAAADEDGCAPCILTGTSCDGCNKYLVGLFRCINVCGGGGPGPIPN